MRQPEPGAPVACDDDGTEDGKYNFETSGIEAALLNGQTGMTVTYFNQNGTELPSPLPNPFFTQSQNVTAVVTNPLNTNCSDSTILNFTVRPLPSLLPDTEAIICEGVQSIVINAGIAQGSSQNFTYQWYKNSVLIGGATTTSLVVAQSGVYSLTAKLAGGCTIENSNSAAATTVVVNPIPTASITRQRARPYCCARKCFVLTFCRAFFTNSFT